ncbi:hypothetical protein PCK2_000461 [Pneumocystis canis]|nr:hypothetical protein PCK2_000461 [Pneumocystis canis]
MLKKRDPGEKGEVIGEDELLALILKEKVQEPRCKEKLKEYCGSLKDAGLESKQVHEKLDVCEEENGNAKDEKCTGLKNEIENKCRKFKDELKAELGKNQFTEENCKKYEPQCHFLEGACVDELKEECSKLRNQCYGLKRDKVAQEVLLRALKGGLKEENKKECEEKLKEKCKRLNGFSKELMRLCLHSEGTCKHLEEEAKNKCTSLKKEVKEVENIEKGTCHSLLKQCYFYGPNCKDKETKTKCEELKTHCEDKHDIMYTPPEEPWFPIQPMPDIADKVGLEELYNEAAKSGLLIEGLRTSMEDLILYLSQEDQKSDFNQEECKKIDEKKCNYLKELSGDLSYNCTNIDKECGKLEGKLQQRRKTLEGRIKETNLFDGEGGRAGKAKTIPWHKLDSDFYGKKCAQLQSDCFFLSRYNNDLIPVCENVQAMCYKRGLNLAAYGMLESQIRGVFNILNTENHECEKKLVEVCNGVRNQSYYLLALCSHPKETCSSLSDEILDKTYQLRDILEFTRDSPEEHDCLKLEPKCNRLKEENNQVLGQPCHTLERNCRHLRETQQLRDLLLGERKNLDDIKHCRNEINDKCHYYSRKIDKQFKLSCALQNDTCEIIDFYVDKYCENLQGNIKNFNIVDTLNETKDNMDELRELCPTWLPYCDALLPSCAKELAKEDNDTLCPGIQKYCGPYQERQAVEDAVFYEFRGYLTNNTQCMFKLDGYCTQGIKLANKTLKADGKRCIKQVFLKRSHSYNSILEPISAVQTSIFSPPLYGHPPGPLASLSFTSLFRTSSLHLSTTPESSDNESFNRAQNINFVKRYPLTAKVPTYEYYGFVLYLGSTIVFGIYIIWSYFPVSLLDAMGITYYPGKWWSLTFPSYFIIAIIYIYFVLIGYNTKVLTPKFNQMECITDLYAKVSSTVNIKPTSDAVIDLPIGEVSFLLYGDSGLS